MAAEMTEKPLTEAQRLVARLESEFQMAPAAIAREIKLSASVIHNIKTRHTTGNLQLPRLRRLMSVIEQGPTQSATEMPFSNGAISTSFADIVPDISIDARDEPASIDLNAEEPAPAESKNLKDRASDWLRAAMLGDSSQPSVPSMSAPSRKKKSEGAGVEQSDLIEQLVPLAALLFVLSGSVLIPDPYKACGPNQAEASAIAYPIVKRAVRELDARKRLSEATMDAVAILLAVGAYGVRAQQTYQQIRAAQAEEIQHARSDRSSSGADFLAASGGGAAPAAADAQSRSGLQGNAVSLPAWRGDARRSRSRAGSETGGEPISPEQRRADASIEQLLAADHAGRLRLGL